MFERFTDRARRTIVQAQEESRALHHHQIGPEHLLLAVANPEIGGLGVRMLTELGITREQVRDQLGLAEDPEVDSPTGHIPFTPEAKKTLELSLREALQLNDSYIGTEHIVLGLIRQDEGPAARALQELGADLDSARVKLFRLRPEMPGAVRVARAGSGSEGGEATDLLRAEVELMRGGLEALRQEVGRLRGLLERHGIDPDEDGGPAEESV